jgi:hypothetical protein
MPLISTSGSSGNGNGSKLAKLNLNASGLAKSACSLSVYTEKMIQISRHELVIFYLFLSITTLTRNAFHQADQFVHESLLPLEKCSSILPFWGPFLHGLKIHGKSCKLK